MTSDQVRAEIKSALRAGDMERAWTWVSRTIGTRTIGTRIVAGDLVVKLKKHRL